MLSSSKAADSSKLNYERDLSPIRRHLAKMAADRGGWGDVGDTMNYRCED